MGGYLEILGAFAVNLIGILFACATEKIFDRKHPSMVEYDSQD